MSKSHKLAWAAGFFDGEGYISIQISKHGDLVRHSMVIGANQVLIEPLLELQKLFGGEIYNRKPYRKQDKPSFGWKLSIRNGAAEALKQMMPYVVNKKSVVEIGLEFANTVDLQRSLYRTPDEVKEKRQELRNKLIHINSLS